MLVVRTYQNGTQETMLINLYKGKFRLPVEYLSEYQQKDGKVHLIDGSTVELTDPKKQKGSLEVRF